MKEKMKRLWCSLWGCQDDGHCCSRCGADYYGDFYSEGRMYWFQCRYWDVRLWVRNIWLFLVQDKECAECGKEMNKWTDRHRICCSEECEQRYIPF